MVVEQFVIDTLLQDSRVTALIGSRSYPLLPEFDPAAVQYPAVVFRLSDREREYDHGGQSDGVRSRFEIICVGKKYRDVVHVAGAVRLAFNGAPGVHGSGSDTIEIAAAEIEGEEDLPYAPNDLQDLSLYARGLALLIAHKEEI